MTRAALIVALLASHALVAVAVFTITRRRIERDASAARAAQQRRAADLESDIAGARAETRLRDQILSSMGEGVMLIERGRVAYANPAARALLGVDEATMHPAVVPVPVDDRPLIREVTLHHPERRELRVASTRTPGDRVVVVVQDITDIKLLDEIRRDFVANASHELKTPVSAILATAETLQGAIGDDPEVAQRFTATLVREAIRLSEMVSDLLDLARLEQRGTETLDDVDLSALVEAAVERARARAERAQLQLTADIAPGLAVRGRDEDLALLPANLLDNAIRYTPPGGSITVRLRAEDGHATFEVTDTGVGIPQKDLHRIFERFFRVDAARSRETGGTGLGLAIVRHVAESHGGSVAAESELGTGSTFRVSLPLVPSRTI